MIGEALQKGYMMPIWTYLQYWYKREVNQSKFLSCKHGVWNDQKKCSIVNE